MDARALRAVLVEGLEAGAISEISRVAVRDPFLAGELDLELAALAMDSLAKMELCIAIEVGTGVSLAPEELDRYRSLGALVTDLERRTGA
jgi:acyl carrier protein